MRHFDGVDVILCAETESTFEDLGISEPFVLPIPIGSPGWEAEAECGVCTDPSDDDETERYVLCWKVDAENYLKQGWGGMFPSKSITRVIPLTN